MPPEIQNAAGQLQGQLWTTRGQRHPFQFWRDGVAQAFTALTATPLDERPFSGQIHLQPLGDEVTLSEIRSTAQTVHRTRSDIRNKPCDAVFINFQSRGRCSVTQRGIDARMPTGSLVLLDARQPFGMRFDNRFEQWCLQVPVSRLQSRGIRIEAALARAIGPSSPFARPLTAAVRDAAAVPGDPGRLSRLLDLLKPALTDAHNHCLADQHLSLIQEYVRQHLSQQGLSPQTVAAHFRISTRHLHKLFARGDQSFGQFVLRSRLVLSAQLLTTRPGAKLSDIASAAGFTSLSHFSRSFRAHFGLPASTMRNRAVHSAPDHLRHNADDPGLEDQQ